MGAMRERDIEAALTSTAKRAGWLSVKWSPDGSNGWPDRLLLGPGGQTVLVEVKAPGKRPEPLQDSRHRRLRALGHRVEVVDSLEQAKTFFDRL